jgi:hypothetical protein
MFYTDTHKHMGLTGMFTATHPALICHPAILIQHPAFLEFPIPGHLKYGQLNLGLVGGFNPSEKYSSIGINDYFQYMEPTKMFQTTNQQYIHYSKARFFRLEPDEILI